MNIVDSSVWLSYFVGNDNAAVFSYPIKDSGRLIVSSITVTEVFKCVLRQRGKDMALESIAHMVQGEVVPLDGTLAIDAACYGLEYKLLLADSTIYAMARKFGALVWTQDADFESLEDVKYFPKKEIHISTSIQLGSLWIPAC